MRALESFLDLSTFGLVELRADSAGSLDHVSTGFVNICIHASYPIHCSAGGRPGGFTTKGDSRRCINSSGVYLTAITVAIAQSATMRRKCSDSWKVSLLFVSYLPQRA